MPTINGIWKWNETLNQPTSGITAQMSFTCNSTEYNSLQISYTSGGILMSYYGSGGSTHTAHTPNTGWNNGSTYRIIEIQEQEITQPLYDYITQNAVNTSTVSISLANLQQFKNNADNAYEPRKNIPTPTTNNNGQFLGVTEGAYALKEITEVENANNVTDSIGSHALTEIFESDGTTVKEATSANDPNAVHFTQQTLTSEQQTQARTNIGAADSATLSGIIMGTTAVARANNDASGNPIEHTYVKKDELSDVTVGNATNAVNAANAETAEKVANALTVTVNGEETEYDGSAAAAVTVSASNPNLLDNSNFAINQGGGTSWSSVGQTVDRWRKTASTGTVTLTTGSNQSLPYQIRLTGGAGIAQYLERDFLRNKNYTITVGYAAGTGATNITERSYTFRVPDSSNQNYTEEIATDLYVTIYVKQYSSSLHSYIRISDDSSSGRYIYYIKLEEGDVATPYEIPDPATELLKCQRYYIKFNGAKLLSGSFNSGGKSAYVLLPIPATMRTTPSIVSYDATEFRIDGNRGVDIQSLSVNNAENGLVNLQFTTSGTNAAYQATTLFLESIELSAELTS